VQPTPVPNWLVARVKAASDADTRVKAASDADTSRLCLITSIVMLERRNGVAGLLHGHLRSTMSSKDQEGRRHHVRRHIAGAQAGAARLKLGLHDSIFSGLRHGEYPQAQKSRWGLRSRRWLLRHEAQHVKGDAAAFTGFECPTRTSLGRGGSVMAITRCDSASATSKRQKQ
jgi:hypothetical protein